MNMQKIYITSIHRNRQEDNLIVVKGYSSQRFDFSSEHLIEDVFVEETRGVSFFMTFHKKGGKLIVNQCEMINLTKWSSNGLNYNDGLRAEFDHTQLVIKKFNYFGQIKNMISNAKLSKNVKEMIFQFAAFLYRLIFNHYTIALFADRIDKGNDNAEVLYREITNKKIKKYFIIRKNSPDYIRLKEDFRVVPFGSFKHKVLALIADYVISSHADYFLLNPFLKDTKTFTGFFNYRFIFLQHGVTKDDLSSWLKRDKKNIYYLITSAQKEADSFLKGAYNYNQNEIKITGMPRFDHLTNEMTQKKIVFMPTWRADLAGEIDESTGKFSYNPEFKQSTFFAHVNNVLSSPELDSLLKKSGYDFLFVPHPNLIQQERDFYRSERIEIQTENVNYGEIIASAKILITDYSSVAFDFAYANKDVIYYHFDEGNLSPGYFNYSSMGFGPVVNNASSLIDELSAMIQNTDAERRQQYSQRTKDFFMYNDQENSQRVAKLIR